MEPDAVKGGVKLGVAFCIALFTAGAVYLGDDGGLWRVVLYVAAGAVCCGLVWPTQDQGDAFLDWMKGEGVEDDQ